MPLITSFGLGGKVFSPFAKSFARGFVEVVDTLVYSRANASSDTSIAFSTVSGSFANNLQSGDLLVAYIGASVGDSTAGNKDYTPSGFVNITSGYQNSTYDAVLNASFRVSDGTETGLLLKGTGSSSYSQTLILQAYRNVDLSNPINGFALGGSLGTFQSSAPNVTTTEKNCLIVGAFSGASDNPNPYVSWPYETRGFWSTSANDTYDSMLGIGAYDFGEVGTTYHTDASVGHLDALSSTDSRYSSSNCALAITPAYV